MIPDTSGPDLAGLRIQRDEPARPARRRRPLRWAWLAAVAALAGGGAVGARAFLTRPARTEVVRPTVTRADLGNELLTASGYVISRHQAQVGSKLLGRVEKIHADEGQRVKAGQLLAELDEGDLPAQLASIETNLPQARNELRRQQELSRKALTAAVALEAAETRVNNLEAQASVIRAQLEQLKIRAPFDGTITLRNLELGETISPNGFNNGASSDRGFLVADLQQLEAEVDVNESSIAQVRAGQPALVELDGLPGRRMDARVRIITPTADRQKATVKVKVSILHPDPLVRPDMTAKATFLREAGTQTAVRQRPRVYVPAGAIARRGADSGVWQVDPDGALRWTPVTPGATAAGQVEILRGLSGDETLVAKPGSALREGQKVKPAAEGSES